MPRVAWGRRTALLMLLLAAAATGAAETDYYLQRALELLAMVPAEVQPFVLQAGMATQADDYRRAADLAEQGMRRFAEVAEIESLVYAFGQTMLAGIYVLDAQHDRAEALLRDAYDRLVRLGEAESRCAGEALVALAAVLHDTGRHREAVEVGEQAWRVVEQLPESDSLYDHTLFNLAACYRSAGQLADAAPAMRRVLELRRRYHEPDAKLASVLDALAVTVGDPAEAVELQREAQQVRRSLTGGDRFRYLQGQCQLGEFLLLTGHVGEAEVLAREALDGEAALLGPDHIALQYPCRALVATAVAQGHWDEALSTLRRQFELEQAHYGQLLDSMTESGAISALGQSLALRPAVALALIRPADPAARSLAFEVVCRRKGMALAAQLAQRRALRRSKDPEAAACLARLREVQAGMARAAYAGQVHDSHQYAALQAEAEALRRRLALVAPGEATDQATTVATIAAALRPDEAVVEYLSLVPMLPFQAPELDGFGQRIYVAFVLRHGDTAPALVNLGDASVIDRAVEALRDAATRTRRPEPADGPSARRLHGLAWQPLQPHLDGVSRIRIAADGALHAVSFAALPDTDGRCLVERYVLATVLSARDLLRRAEPATAAPAADVAIFADPAFERAPAAPAARPSPEWVEYRSLGLTLTPLLGAGDEAARIESLARRHHLAVSLSLGEDATESALRALPAPRVLHLATHGRYLPAERFGAAAASPIVSPPVISGAADRVAADQRPAASLRSILALAGAADTLAGRPAADAADDGLLTAEEVSALDLRGSNLVVLSACESGLGDMSAGEGVIGLRRSFLVAGADQVVMTLWRIPDADTADLVAGFYEQYFAQGDAAAALAATQRAHIESRRAAGQPNLPYYWAAFVTGE